MPSRHDTYFTAFLIAAMRCLMRAAPLLRYLPRHYYAIICHFTPAPPRFEFSTFCLRHAAIVYFALYRCFSRYIYDVDASFNHVFRRHALCRFFMPLQDLLRFRY